MGINGLNSFNRVMGIDTGENQGINFQDKLANMFGTKRTELRSRNPFLNADGTLKYQHLDYQKLLDNPSISSGVKALIYEATGLTPSDDSYNPYGNIGIGTVFTKGDSSTPTVATLPGGVSATRVEPNSTNSTFNASLDSGNLASMDVNTELPKLSVKQIEAIIKKHFGNSTVITPSDAQGIYDAQQNTGMSALAILGIGALESGYGTSNIAKQKNNIWGWGATNTNPSGNAKTFSQMSQGAYEFANSYMNTYYNKYGAKSINDAGTGNNPAGKGYAYDNNGNISTSWATNVGGIMGKFYDTAKSVTSSATPSTNQNVQPATSGNLKVGSRIADTATYNNSAAKGQCVWYARGRASEKLGITLGSMGNGNEMWYNAKPEAKVAATAENLKPNMLLSYKYGTSSLGQKAGHVIFIEDVVGDTVYYTEGGSGYYKNGTDGVVKTASRKDILKGVNSNGGRIGSEAIGLIDLSKYSNNTSGTSNKTPTNKVSATPDTKKTATPFNAPAVATTSAKKESGAKKSVETNTKKTGAPFTSPGMESLLQFAEQQKNKK